MSRNAESPFKIVRNGTRRAAVRSLLALCSAAMLAASAAGQGFMHTGAPAPKVEVFAGYSFLYPNATATGYLPNGIAPITTCLCAIPDGGGGSLTYNFTPRFGLTADGSVHGGGKSGAPAQTIGYANASNFAIGPQFKLRHKHLSPFAEVLVGGDILSPSVFHQNLGFGLLAGGGLDASLGRHFGIRIFQVDMVYAHHSFAPSPVAATTEVGLRVQGGVTFAFGGAHVAAPLPVPAPAAVMPAAAAAPVVAAAVEAPVEVLTLTAQASPSSMVAGESSTITGNGVSSLGRPLTYSYSSTIGNISGNTETALLTTAGALAGTAIVTVTVMDDMHQTAIATVPVKLESPAMVMPIATSNLCSMSFARDTARPARVNNEGKACLDSIAITLQHDSDAQLVLVGSATPQEPHHKRLAAERAAHTKAYLVDEKGIDPKRVTVYTGATEGKTVTTTLVPAGATLDTTGLSAAGTP